MQCDAFERRLNVVLDRREPVELDQPLRRHALRCERCHRILRSHCRLVGVVEQLEPVDIGRPVVPAPRVATVVPAVAALLFLCLTAWLVFRHQQPIAPMLPVTVAQSESFHREPILPVRPRRDQQTFAMAVHQPLWGLQLISQADWSGTMSSVGAVVGPELKVPSLETQWINTVANEMAPAPVRDSMTSTFNLLRRVVSPSSSEMDETLMDG